jgi:hypothetical protein
MDLTREGHDIWASNWVHQSEDPTYKVLSLKWVNILIASIYTSQIHWSYYNRNNAPAVTLENLKAYTVSLQPPSCTCHQFIFTGKYCKHLWAAQWHKTNGSIDEFLYAQKQGDCG